MNESTMEAPVIEPDRQYYYMEKAKKYVEELNVKLGRPLTFCVTTFGCQMNPENEIARNRIK